MEQINKATNDWYKRMLKSWVDKYPAVEGDYEVDGILYCGKCKEPKRKYVDVDGEQVFTSRECKCVRDERERERQREEYEKKLKEINRLKSVSLMDAVFYEATFKAFDVTESNKKNYKSCVNYVRKFPQMYEEGQGLLFYGPVGTGKSFAAACIANALISGLNTVVMTSLVKLLQQISSFNDKYSEEDLIRDLMRPKLLILDDLGAERSTDFALEKVYNIIDSRYRAHKPLILTTNLTLQEMKENADIRYARIYDRVFEMCYPMKFDGVSRRKIEARERYNKMKSLLEDE